jgi:hypothetical protein
MRTFLEALVDYKADQKSRLKETKAKEAQSTPAYEDQIKSHVDKVNSFKESRQDWDELMEEVE